MRRLPKLLKIRILTKVPLRLETTGAVFETTITVDVVVIQRIEAITVSHVTKVVLMDAVKDRETRVLAVREDIVAEVTQKSG